MALKTGDLSTSISTVPGISCNVKPVALSTSIAVVNELDRNIEYERELDQSVAVNNQVKRGIDGELEVEVAPTDEITRGEAPSNTVAVSQELTATVAKGLQQPITVTVAIAATREMERVLAQAVVVANSIVAYVVGNDCGLHEYTPNGTFPVEPTLVERSTIEFQYGSNILELRNPEFNDTVTPDPLRALNITRGGQVRVYRNPNWRAPREISFRVVALTLAEKDAILAFLEASFGREVRYIDPESREWLGVIIDPNAVIVDNGTCRYEAAFRFRGVPDD